MKYVELLGQIKELRTFLSESGDKSATVKFLFNGIGNDEVIDGLNRLHRPEENVIVIVCVEHEYEDMIKKLRSKRNE